MGGTAGCSELARIVVRRVIEGTLDLKKGQRRPATWLLPVGVEEGRGYRNDTNISRIKPAEGAIEMDVPQIAG